MDAMPREPTHGRMQLPTRADDQNRMVEKSWIWMEDTVSTTIAAIATTRD
jgi:hypothetical protein